MQSDSVLRFAARLIDQISKLTIYYLRYVLHWLSLRKRIEFRIAVLVLAMFKRNVPAYLIDLCSRVVLSLVLGVSSPSARLTGASFKSHLLVLPPCKTGPVDYVVGSLVWNSLPLALWSLPRIFSQVFFQQLETALFSNGGLEVPLSSSTCRGAIQVSAMNEWMSCDTAKTKWDSVRIPKWPLNPTEKIQVPERVWEE